MHEAAILTTPLRGAKNWTVYSTHAGIRSHFLLRYLHRYLLGIHPRLGQRQLRRSGHLTLKIPKLPASVIFPLRNLFRNPPVIRMNYGWAITDRVNDPYEGPKSNSGICKKS
nr:unnamed protein product [Spirometra erinaceieuropaei]